MAFAASTARARSSSVMEVSTASLEGCCSPTPTPARGEGSRLTVGVGVAVVGFTSVTVGVWVAVLGVEVATGDPVGAA